MAKAASDAVLDGALERIAESTILVVCTQEPTTHTEATTTYALADTALTAGDGNGDFVIANGDTSGRKVTTSEQASVPVDTTGSATHVALCTSTDLRYVTTCTAQSLTAGNTVTIPAWKVEIADPS